jgi:hypothetical protein
MPPAPTLRRLIVAVRSLVLVPTVGFEPTRLAALAPQASVSTNSTTWANIFSSGVSCTASLDGLTSAAAEPESPVHSPVQKPVVVPPEPDAPA